MHFCGHCWCHSRTRNRKCFTHFVGFSISLVMRKTAKSQKKQTKKWNFSLNRLSIQFAFNHCYNQLAINLLKGYTTRTTEKKPCKSYQWYYIRLLNRLARFFLSWLDPMDTFDWLAAYFSLLPVVFFFVFADGAVSRPVMQIRLHVGKLLPSKSIGYAKPRNKKVLR